MREEGREGGRGGRVNLTELLAGLKSRMNAGRPNWNKVFSQLRQERKGEITVFYCGNPGLASTLRRKCEEFGFNFRKEVF